LPPGAALAGNAGHRQTGAAAGLYRKHCQRYHEPDGTGQHDRLPGIPNFRDRVWHRGRNDFALAASILDGKGTRMPPFSERLDGWQVRELVVYLRGFAPDAIAASRAGISWDGDFEARFRQLKQELDDLQRQFKELAGPH
jgi:mono/diheme cytochrome c family protein